MRMILAAVMWFVVADQGPTMQMMMSHRVGFPPITLGSHCATDNGATSATTVACTLTPTAGSAIYCDVKQPNVSNPFVVFDSNDTSCSTTTAAGTGCYQPAYSRLRDANHDFNIGGFYRENVAGGSTTITASWVTTGTHAQIACKELQGVPTSYVLDSNVVASQATTGTNPNSGSSLTPTGNGRFIGAAVNVLSSTPTAGTNFTLLDAASTFSPEYWIQGTATATTGPFTDASSIAYGAGMAAFAPNHSGTCDSTMIMDWTGGTNGGTVGLTDLANSTHGGLGQPNADNISPRPGWTLAGSGLVYSTSAYQPLATSRTCPFYSGSAAGTLGISWPTSAAATQEAGFHFDSSAAQVSAYTCISTDISPATTGTADLLAITGGDQYGNPDYVLFQWNSNGTVGTWGIEAQGRSTVVSTNNWAQNAKYGVRLTYKYQGRHTIDIYNGCGANPSLIETLTTGSGQVGGGNADQLYIGGSSNSYAGGGHFYYGALAVDILHGAAILP